MFGTDGIRGCAKNLDKEGYKLGRALEGAETVLVIGDNRPSHERLVSALVHGLTDAKVNVIYGGVLPTPAACECVDYFAADYAVVVTASHNPPQDNGYKLIGKGGAKVERTTLDEIEKRMSTVSLPDRFGAPLPPVTKEVARVYLDRVTPESVPQGEYVFDCANGSTYPIVKRVFGGGRYINHGEGKKINVLSGATHPEAVEAARRAGEWGFSFDGDGDRLIAVSPLGRVMDGDAILYALAVAYHRRGKLAKDIVVGTVMSNGGLDLALAKEGIHLVRTEVGDHHVAAKMKEEGAILGAEPSGHVLLNAPSDGIKTALALAALSEQTDVDTLLKGYEPLPQVHRTVPLAVGIDKIQKRADLWRGYLGGTGRIVLRASGTEQVYRVMVECKDPHLAAEIADGIALGKQN